MLDTWATGKVFALTELIIYWGRPKISHTDMCVIMNYSKCSEVKEKRVKGKNNSWD